MEREKIRARRPYHTTYDLPVELRQRIKELAEQHGVPASQLATLGLLRFPDTLTRLHALTKADNLGLGLVVLGLLPQVPWPTGLKLIAVWLLALFAGATVGQAASSTGKRSYFS